jgi:hypothetical protein
MSVCSSDSLPVDLAAMNVIARAQAGFPMETIEKKNHSTKDSKIKERLRIEEANLQKKLARKIRNQEKKRSEKANSSVP